MRKVEMKRILIIGVVFFVLAGTSWGWGEGIAAETSEDLKGGRMQVAVDLQILQLELQGIVDRMKVLREDAQKLAPRIEKLKKEFMDLTDKINKN